MHVISSEHIQHSISKGMQAINPRQAVLLPRQLVLALPRQVALLPRQAVLPLSKGGMQVLNPTLPVLLRHPVAVPPGR